MSSTAAMEKLGEILTCFLCTEDINSYEASFAPCICTFRICQCCWFRITATSRRCPACRQFFCNASSFTLHSWIRTVLRIRSDGAPYENTSLELLNTITYYRPDTKISSKLLRKVFQKSELDFAISTLHENGLIHIDNSENEDKEFCCIIIKADDQIFSQRCFSVSQGISHAVEAIQSEFEFGFFNWKKENIDMIQMTFPHAFTLWDHISNDSHLIQQFLFLAKTVICALDREGSSHAALEFTTSVLSTVQKIFGEQSLETYDATYHYACTLTKVYKFEEALKILSQFPTKPMAKMSSDEKSEVMLILHKAKSCMGYCLCKLGDLNESIRVFENLFQTIDLAIENGVLEEVTTCQMISTMMYRNAIALTGLNRDDEAMALVQKTHATNILKYTERSHKTILTKKLIASIYTKKGNFVEALQIYKQVQELENEILKNYHQQHLITVAAVAGIYVKMRNYKQVLEICQETLKEFSNHKCPDNELEMLLVKRELGKGYLGMKRGGVARALFQEILDQKLEILGDERHPFISLAVKDLNDAMSQ